MNTLRRAAIAVLCTLTPIPAGAGPASRVAGVVRSGGTPEANTVVWLDVPGGVARREQVVLDQRNSSFYPHVLAVRTGTTVDFPNNDRVFHNVFSFHDGKRFDLGLYPIGAVKRIVFDRPGLSRIFCNIHPQMAAYIMAVDSAYFVVSDADGRFALDAVPDGTYTYHAWRPGAEIMSGRVDVREGAVLEVLWP